MLIRQQLLFFFLWSVGVEGFAAEASTPPRFEGKTPVEWARLQRGDLSGFQKAVDAFGIAAARHWAELLAPGHKDEERFPPMDAPRPSLRDEGMRATQTAAETLAVPALLPLLREKRAFVRARTMRALESI